MVYEDSQCWIQDFIFEGVQNLKGDANCAAHSDIMVTKSRHSRTERNAKETTLLSHFNLLVHVQTNKHEYFI